MQGEIIQTSLLNDEALDVEADEQEIETGNTSDPIERKRANELDGKTWTKNSISIWSDIQKSSEERALGHPAIFPVALVTRLIETFTRKKQRLIFDPFAGVGSTLVAAQRLGKDGVGMELSTSFIEKAEKRFLQTAMFESASGSAKLYQDDALNLLQYIEENSVDLVVTSPPYWDILNEKRTADNKEIRHYGNHIQDLGTINDYKQFLTQLQEVFSNVYKSMRPKAYCCVVVMDIRKKSNFYPFHSDIATFMQEIGFIYDDLIIWDRRSEYNNMRPLGYPAVFRINKAHEFILIFQKPS